MSFVRTTVTFFAICIHRLRLCMSRMVTTVASYMTASASAVCHLPPPPPYTQAATEYGANWSKAWHHWALFNCGLLEALVKQGDTGAARSYVAPAVTGFFRR